MLSLLSPIAMSSAGADMWQGGVRWSALGAGQHPLGKVMGMLAVDTVVYFVLALYFERAIGEEAWDLCFCLPESVRRVLRLRALSAQDATDHVPLLNVSSDDDFAPEGARVVEGRSAGRGEAVGLCGDEEMGISALGGSGRGLGGSQECGVLIRSVRKVFDGTCAQDESVHGSTTVAIDGVTLDLLPGQIVALLGPNGAGKSTLINLLTGKLLPSAGHISVFGRRVDCTWDLQKIHENLGYCPQDDILLEDLTVREHLQLFAGLKGRGNEEVRLRSHELDLASVLDKQVKTLSGGFKRRLSVALALTGDPRLVILDEPSSGMDTTSRRALWAALKQNRADRVLLVSTHSMEEADAMADRLAILVHGTLKACGEPMALKSKFGLGYRLHCVRSPPAHSAPDEGGATAAALASSHQRGRAGGGMAAGLEKLEGWVKQHVAEAKVVATSASEVTFELGLPDALPVKGTSSHAAAGGAPVTIMMIVVPPTRSLSHGSSHSHSESGSRAAACVPRPRRACVSVRYRSLLSFSFTLSLLYRSLLSFTLSLSLSSVIPPSCSNLPTKSFPFSEKVFMPPPRRGEVTSLIFRPGYGQYGYV